MLQNSFKTDKGESASWWVLKKQKDTFRFKSHSATYQPCVTLGITHNPLGLSFLINKMGVTILST